MQDGIRSFSRHEALVDERRKQIVKYATKLFVKKGYDRTSVRELASASGMSQGGLYHYIASKEDILQLILDFVTDNQMKRLELYRHTVANLSPTQALRQSIEMYLEGVDDVQDLINFVNHVMVNLSQDRRHIVFDSERRVVAYFEHLLRKGIDAGEFKMNNPTVVAHNIVVLGGAWAHRRWFLRSVCPLKEYAREQAEIVLNGIAVHKG